jgi:hypothetical protein
MPLTLPLPLPSAAAAVTQNDVSHKPITSEINNYLSKNQCPAPIIVRHNEKLLILEISVA